MTLLSFLIGKVRAYGACPRPWFSLLLIRIRHTQSSLDRTCLLEGANQGMSRRDALLQEGLQGSEQGNIGISSLSESDSCSTQDCLSS